jgi:hypothetical protein
VAKLCDLDESAPEQLETLVENLADVLAGLTSTDRGQAWLQHRHAHLAASEESEAA